MAIRVGINGFGRIGRAFLRGALERDGLEVGGQRRAWRLVGDPVDVGER